MRVSSLLLGLLVTCFTPASSVAQVVRSTDCEMIDRHVALLRQGMPRTCAPADTAFERAVKQRLDLRHEACSVGDLSDPGLEGFRCWITSTPETATLSCLRPLAPDVIEATRTGWIEETPEYVQSLRSAALCPSSNGRSGYAALTLQGALLDEFVKPEFGFTTGLGNRRESLERLTQTFGTGDPLLPWNRGTPIGVETYALTACLAGAACDSDGMVSLGTTPEGWSAKSVFSVGAPAQQGMNVITSMVEVSYREVDVLEPGEPLGETCLGTIYGGNCPIPDAGTAFAQGLNIALSTAGFGDMKSEMPAGEFESFVMGFAPQVQTALEQNASNMVSPYAWRHNRPDLGSQEMMQTVVSALLSGRWKIYGQELKSCPFGGGAFLFVFQDAEDDGRVREFTSDVMSMWLSSCDVNRTKQADEYVRNLIIQTAGDQRQ